MKALRGLERTRLIMLTSLDRSGSMERLDAIGVAGCLIKPVRGRELRDCVARVLEAGRETETGWFRRIVTRGSLSGSQSPTLRDERVLVAEDHPVNQDVARLFLERLGCEVIIVSNGTEAVEAFSSREFDIVLMDVQMPVMDGLAATRAIRGLEAPGRHIPIVALTASAMTDELQRCLTAGMDALLTKPLEFGKLRDVLSKYGASSPRAKRMPVTSQPAKNDKQTIDLARLRANVNDNSEFARTLCRSFVETSAEIMASIGQALIREDRTALSELGHKLRGGSRAVFAERLDTLASLLERNAAGQPLAEMESTVSSIRTELEACTRYIQVHMNCPSDSRI